MAMAIACVQDGMDSEMHRCMLLGNLSPNVSVKQHDYYLCTERVLI